MIVNSLVKLVVTSVALITVACAASVLLIPPPEEEARDRRDREARQMLPRLNEELWRYHADHEAFPPGDGKGSAALARALKRADREGRAYFSFGTHELSEEGDILNPAMDYRTVIHYRNNQDTPLGQYQGHNPLTFDLWCHDARGRPGVMNNWD